MFSPLEAAAAQKAAAPTPGPRCFAPPTADQQDGEPHQRRPTGPRRSCLEQRGPATPTLSSRATHKRDPRRRPAPTKRCGTANPGCAHRAPPRSSPTRPRCWMPTAAAAGHLPSQPWLCAPEVGLFRQAGTGRGGRAALPAGKIGAKGCEIPQGQTRRWRVCAPGKRIRRGPSEAQRRPALLQRGGSQAGRAPHRPGAATAGPGRRAGARAHQQWESLPLGRAQ